MMKFFLGALTLLAVLALLLLVPSSPALMVDMPTVLWSTGGMDEWGSYMGLPITAYSVMIAAGAALAIGTTMAVYGARRQDPVGGAALALTSGACAMVVSHLLFCVLRWGYIINDLGGTPGYLYQFYQGGYTMYGAILGGLLGAALYARVKKQPLPATMDAIIPGMALLLMVGRAAEHFTGQGLGSYVAKDALYMLPFVRKDEWGDVQLPVYIYEAIIAGIALMVVAAMLLRRKSAPGRAAETGLIIISAAQVMLDSWRGDELIRFGFVRLNMIAAAVVLAAIMALRIARAVKAGRGKHLWTYLRLALMLAAAAIVIILEFALDKSTINNTLLYGVMTACVITMGAAVMIDGCKTPAKAA